MAFRPRVAVSFRPAQDSRTIADWLREDGFEPVALSSPARLEQELTQSGVNVLVVDAGFAVAAINAVRARHPLLPIVVVGDTDPSAEAYVPMLGVKISVRRMWTANAPRPAGAVWYGAELSTNSTRAQLAWQTLVDTLCGPRNSVTVQ